MAVAAERSGLLRQGQTRRATPSGAKILVVMQYLILAGVVMFVAMHPALRRVGAGGNSSAAAAPRRQVPALRSADSMRAARQLAKHISPKPVPRRKARAKTKMRVQAQRTLLSYVEQTRTLPPHVAMCYASWGECDDKIVEAARQGCNVITWFAINFRDVAGNISVVGGPKLQCVRSVAATLRNEGLATTHLISIGGWNQAHPFIANGAPAVWESWRLWNEQQAAGGFFEGFDGIDWDIEGCDTGDGGCNKFSIALLDTIGQVSQRAKAEGFIVSMAPMESYLDPSSPRYDRSVAHSYPEWTGLVDFAFHGRNTYAYLLAKYGKTLIPPAGGGAPRAAETYDLVSIQLYESFSHADFAISVEKEQAAPYLLHLMRTLTAGWTVDFSSDPATGLGRELVRLDQQQVLLGLANGWGGSGDPVKALVLEPDAVQESYAACKAAGVAPRGFMFWDVAEEGLVPPGANAPLYLAAALGSILRTRDAVQRES